MPTEDDRRRLYESRHDIKALALSRPVDAPVYLAAVTASADALSSARDALRVAMVDVAREQGDASIERSRLRDAADTVVAVYAFVHGRARSTLINVDPESGLTAAEIERRQALLDGVFKHSRGSLARVSEHDLVEIIHSVVHSLKTVPELRTFGFAPRMAKANRALAHLRADLVREDHRTLEALGALDRVRSRFDRHNEAHRALITSVLIRGGRRGDLGVFLLAEQPSYKARRLSGAPMDAEPDIETIDSELRTVH